jgi:hypothetical protein
VPLDLSGVADRPVHVSGFAGYNPVVLKLVTMAVLQTNVPAVVPDPGVNGTASLPNVILTTFAANVVYAWSSGSQANYLPRWEAHRLDVLDSK